MFFGEEKMKTKVDKKMVKLDFWAYTKKISTFTFGAWSFLLVHIWFTPNEGPKAFVDYFFKEIELWKKPPSIV